MKAQGSITIRRLRTGDSLFVSFDSNNIDLWQGVDAESGAVAPDWTVAANQPVRTPRASSARGNAVTLVNHSWKRAGTDITFSKDAGGGWMEDATGTFRMNTTTGALRICKNLATRNTVGGITLTWEGVANVSGTEYLLTRDLDIRIGNMGSSSYVGSIIAATEQLSSSTPSTTINTSLRLGANTVTNYHIKWFKDNEQWTAKNGQKSITVTRDDVDGTQLFIAEFFKTTTDVNPVARFAVRIIDVSDDFQVFFRITSENRDVAEGKPVTAKGYVVNMTTGSEVSTPGATWRVDAYDKDTWTILKTSNTDSIVITATETDRDSQEKDVEVLGEADF